MGFTFSKKILSWVCGLLFLLSFSNVYALDCSKARSETEKAMCAEPSLVTQNAYLESLYLGIYNGLRNISADLARQLMMSERQWIKERDSKCRASKECISYELYSRANDLYEWGKKGNLVSDNRGKELTGSDLYRVGTKFVALVKVRSASGSNLGSAVKLWREHFLTNQHVVDGATEVEVEFQGRRYKGTVVAKNPKLDLAAIHVPGVPQEAWTIAPLYEVAPGQPVYALGNPGGLTQTISNGIVSAIREDQYGGGFMVIQNTAPISPGSSGGALIDQYGRVVGITTYSRIKGPASTVEPQLINFSIPVEQVMTLVVGQR